MRSCLLFFILLLLISCSDEKNETNLVAEHTLVVYMAADNNLYSSALKDIDEMLQCSIPENYNVVIYLDAPAYSSDSIPKIFIIQKKKLVRIEQFEIENSASATTLRNVIDYAINKYPANNFGLILWSHGTGWLPEGVFDNLIRKTQNKNGNLQYSFAKDNGKEMDIIDLSNALPIKFKYIVLDACLMSNIEVLYQLRNKADYIMASPTEEFGTGYPYNDILPLLLNSQVDYMNVAKKYMEFYSKKSGIFQSATIAVIKTKQLEELASSINITNRDLSCHITVTPDSIQKYQVSKNCFYYDLKDVFLHSYNNENYNFINDKISSAVYYNDYTTYFLNELYLKSSCGISVFVFPYYNEELVYKYKQLDWFKDTKLIISKSL